MITAWIKDLESSKLDWKCLRNLIFFRERLPSRHWAWNKALKNFAIIPIIFFTLLFSNMQLTRQLFLNYIHILELFYWLIFWGFMNCLKLFLNILSFEMKCCIVFLSKFIISIYVWKLVLSKTHMRIKKLWFYIKWILLLV